MPDVIALLTLTSCEDQIAQQLTADRGIADYFEETVREAGGTAKSPLTGLLEI